MDEHSIYLHIPFCARRCRYCDFNTYSGMLDHLPAYVDALCHEIELVGNSTNTSLSVHTIYFGGGTPSLLSEGQIGQILVRLRQSFDMTGVKEITLEMNPGTAEREYLSCLYNLGVNRLSIGIQSAVPAELSMLGRIHNVAKARQAIKDARLAGFDNINLDFIYGLPGQTATDWQQSLDFAMENAPEHLSLYALTLEDHTPMARQIENGSLEKPDDDHAADLYEIAIDHLAAAGYQQYEISNWAASRKGTIRKCIHNLQYWYNQSYLGFGAGAHGYSQGYRTANVGTITKFIARINTGKPAQFPFSPANDTQTVIDEWTRLKEAMILGLRLTSEGIARSHYLSLYHVDYYEIYNKQINKLLNLELLEWIDNTNEILRLTRKGRLLGNQVFMEFVGDESKP